MEKSNLITPHLTRTQEVISMDEQLERLKQAKKQLELTIEELDNKDIMRKPKIDWYLGSAINYIEKIAGEIDD
jgi:hypothetical protein